MLLKSKILLSAAVHAMPTVPAFAQDVADSSASASDVSAQPVATNTGSQEIIVTAQRRQQRLQDVPISVTALSGSELQEKGITSSHDLAQSISGMTITESGGYVQPFIRGVGSTVTNIGEEGSAAFYVDGVYMPSINGQLYQLANVESIQVLKGPQGTLFGRNANTGAIIITTKQPQFIPEMSVNLGYGNYDSISVNGFVTGPLTDNVALSVAANYDRHDGYFKNKNPANGLGDNVGDSRRWTARAALLVEPSDEISITLTADAMDINDASPIILQPISGYQGFTPGGLLPEGDYDYIGNETIGYLVEQQGVSGKLDWDFGGVTLSSTTAYRHYENHSINYDSDTTPFPYTSINNSDVGNSFTQEMLINSNNDSNLNWVVGGFYMNKKGKLDPLNIIVGGTTNIDIEVQQLTEVYAGFADATLTLGKLELTGGIRYNHETKTINGQSNGTPVLVDESKSWDSFTPRAVVAFHPNDDAMIYASFAQGFKSGAFNANALSPTPIDPETVDAYEIGAKLNPLNELTINVAAFYYMTKDLQVQALNSGNNLIELINAAEVESKGVDLEITYSAIPNLNLSGSVSYLDATFKSFPNAQIYLPVPGGDGRNFSTIADVTGKDNVRSPEWTFNIAADYTAELGNGGSLQPSFNVYHSSKFYWTVDERLVEPAHTLVNASLTYNLPGDRMSLTGWVRNLFDVTHFRNVSAATQADRRAADEPRLYGVRLSYRY